MNKIELLNFLISRNISCSEKQMEQLLHIMQSTLETNEKFNLTAIKDEAVFMEKMILDSAIGLYDLDLTGKSLIDVGTGAGFPGMVIKTLMPECNVTLLDSTKKKIDYLQELSDELDMNNICVNARAEDYAKNHIEKYDYATARAVSSLSMLLEIIIPMLKVGGTFVAYKGLDGENEVLSSLGAMKKLGCKLKKIYIETLPECQETRCIIHIAKEKSTPKKYPRDYATIKKLPL
jgi:16S rRNA (guanine527-N7)-methyltransferase